MKEPNDTVLTFFIIKGISDNPDMQTPIFLMVLFIYLIGLCGNMTIFILVFLDSQLQTPMYFFLCNLSILDISATTNTLHKVFTIFISGDNMISFLGCMIQMFFFLCLLAHVSFLLTAMSYDRYVAICNPLRYVLVMKHRICVLLFTVCWLLSFLMSLPEMLIIPSFSCYRSNEINHFFCDITPIIKLTCSDTSVLELFIIIRSALGGLTSFLLTFISYIFIISTILRIRSSIGRRKAFHTCSSHLTVVVILYMSLFSQYLRPISMNSLDSVKIVSLFNTAVVPMLNPLIYSLKNKDVTLAVRRRWRYCKNIVCVKSEHAI